MIYTIQQVDQVDPPSQLGRIAYMRTSFPCASFILPARCIAVVGLTKPNRAIHLAAFTRYTLPQGAMPLNQYLPTLLERTGSSLAYYGQAGPSIRADE